MTSAFCVIHQKNGAFLAQAASTQNTSTRQSRDTLPRNVVTIKHAVAGVICNDNVLLCLEASGNFVPPKRELSAYAIETSGNNVRNLGKRRLLSKLDKHIDKSAGMALSYSNDRVELVFFSGEKNDVKVLRYTLHTLSG